MLFLSADTGGGHRASSESLAAQVRYGSYWLKFFRFDDLCWRDVTLPQKFLSHFPGSTYDLLDIWSTDGVWPWSTLVDSYTHMSARPKQWRFFFHMSNMWISEKGADWHSNASCGRKIRKTIASYDPDVVVCVHPGKWFIWQHATPPISACSSIFSLTVDLHGPSHEWIALLSASKDWQKTW